MRYVLKNRFYIFLVSLFDAIGKWVFSARKDLRREKPLRTDRILLIRCDHIGDVIASTAVLAPLKKTFPNSLISFLTASWSKEVLEDNPNVDELVLFDAPWFDRTKKGSSEWLDGIKQMTEIIKKGNYDVTVDLRGDLRHILAMYRAGVGQRVGYGITGGGFLLTRELLYEGVKRETERNMDAVRAIGVRGEAGSVELRFSEEDRRRAAEIIKELVVDGPYAVLHMWPGHASKEWALERFAEVARFLREKKIAPVIIGSVKDSEKAWRIKDAPGVFMKDITGKTTLGVLYHVIGASRLFVGVDSSPAHIAAATATPTVVLFSGVNEPAQWAPAGRNVRVIWPGSGRGLSEISSLRVCQVIEELLK